MNWLDLRRTLGLVVALLLLVVALPLLLIIAICIKVDSGDPVFFRSDRIGRYGRPFCMFKFRTMNVGAPEIPTHLMDNPAKFTTPVGRFLRKFSLDEVPQLLNVIRGDMRLIGPRPALYSQDDLNELREREGISALYPGITGWAQVNGRDDLDLESKVALEKYYLEHKSVVLDCKIVLLTAVKVLTRSGVAI